MRSFSWLGVVVLFGCGGEVAWTDEPEEVVCTHPDAVRSPKGAYDTHVWLEPGADSSGCAALQCEVWAGHGLHLSCAEPGGEVVATCDFVDCVCQSWGDDLGSFEADFSTMRAVNSAASTCHYAIRPQP